MNILQRTGILIGVIVAVVALLYLFRSNPIGPIPGKALSGDAVPYPSSWEVCNQHATVAIEVRPENPYSVTTWCFVYQDMLYIPSIDATTRTWTQLTMQNPLVRIKIGDNIYPARATRVTDLADMSMQAIESAVLLKYPEYAQYRDRGANEVRAEDTWLFRISKR